MPPWPLVFGFFAVLFPKLVLVLFLVWIQSRERFFAWLAVEIDSLRIVAEDAFDALDQVDAIVRLRIA